VYEATFTLLDRLLLDLADLAPSLEIVRIRLGP
jgi:hypothetical protein